MSSFPDEMGGMNVYPGNTAMRLVFMSLGDVDQQALVQNTASPDLTVWIYLAWVMLSTVLLINLLIAMMGQTFQQDFEQTHKTWIFPFARLVLSYEESLSPAQKSLYRTGEPGTTDLLGQDGNIDRDKEVFYHIVIAEDEMRKREAKKEHEQRKKHRLTLLKLRGVTMQMHIVTSSIKYLASSIADVAGSSAAARHSQGASPSIKSSMSDLSMPPITPTDALTPSSHANNSSPGLSYNLAAALQHSEPISERRNLKQPNLRARVPGAWGGVSPLGESAGQLTPESPGSGAGNTLGASPGLDKSQIKSAISGDNLPAPATAKECDFAQGGSQQRAESVDKDMPSPPSSSLSSRASQHTRGVDVVGTAAPSLAQGGRLFWGEPASNTLPPSGSTQSSPKSIAPASHRSHRLNTIVSEDLLGSDGSFLTDTASFRVLDPDTSGHGPEPGGGLGGSEGFGWIGALSPPGSCAPPALGAIPVLGRDHDLGRIAAWMGI